MNRNILFLTSNNIATNPRLLKEMQLALSLGYDVTTVTFILGNWSDEKSEIMLDDLAKRYPNFKTDSHVIRIWAKPKSKIHWLFWGILEKMARKLYPFLKKSVFVNSLASNRRSIQIYQSVKKSLTFLPTIICAHNLSALYAGIKLSNKWSVPCVFDVEDYHPGEFVKLDSMNEKQRRQFLMQQLMPKTATVTYASPLIKKHTEDLVGEIQFSEVVLNGFSKAEFEPEKESETYPKQKLKLVWFSQTVSFGRGLEQFFEAIASLNLASLQVEIEITLIGEMDSSFKKTVLDPIFRNNKNEYLTFEEQGPMLQSDLHKKLDTFDIGLALEFDQADLNRQICLTNKILAYSQAGLYVLATDTQAQKQFITSYNDLGVIAVQTKEGILKAISFIINERDTLRANKNVRKQIGRTFSWESESLKIKEIWNQF